MRPSSSPARESAPDISPTTRSPRSRRPSGGAVAMLRISGPARIRRARNPARATGARDPGAESSARRSARGQLRRRRAARRRARARFVAPASFTGEDVVELHVHGGAYLAARAMERPLGLGARQALPGEFSFRAVRNGKMALSQAQAVADLIAASNDGAITLALEKLSGSQNRLIGGSRLPTCEARRPVRGGHRLRRSRHRRSQLAPAAQESDSRRTDRLPRAACS